MARLNRFAAASALAAAFSLASAPALARGHYHRWHHHDRVDGGDVLAGALILGGIAAIASAASRNHADDTPAPAQSLPDDRPGYGDDGAQRDEGLDRAAGLCAKAIERGPNRVDTIKAVIRDGGGTSVEGTLASGNGFDCRIGSEGRVLAVNIGGPADDAAEGADAGADESDSPPDGVDDRPIWHGDEAQPQAPLPPQDDDRYSTSAAPDGGEGV